MLNMNDDKLISDDGKRVPLPNNWQELTNNEKDLFFHRFYLKYLREGETDGLYSWAPDEVKQAYNEFIEENE